MKEKDMTKKSKRFVIIALILFYIGIIVTIFSCESQIIFIKGENNQVKAEEKEDIKVDADSLKIPKSKGILKLIK